MLNSSIVSSFWPAPNIPEEGRGNRRRLLAAWHGWHCAHVSASPPFPLFQILIHKGNSCIHMCLDYTTLLGDEEFFCGGESRAQAVMGGEGREGREGRGGAGRFLLLLWMRYCLVVEHSWETSGHVDSRERAHTVAQKREHIYEVITTPPKEVLLPSVSLCLIFHLSSLFCVFFPPNQISRYPLSFLPIFLLCASCVGLLVKKTIGGCGVVGFLDSSKRVARLMSWERATGLCRQPLTGQPWNPSRCPISPFLTLLFLCACGGCRWKWRRADLSAWLLKVVRCQLAFFSYHSLHSPLRLASCNVNRVRSWHKRSGPREKVREQAKGKWGVLCVQYICTESLP